MNSYQHFLGDDIIDNLLNHTLEYCSGHVIILMRHEDQICVVLCHNREHDNLATFGGFSQENENLLITIAREYEKKSLNSILPRDEMCVALHNGKAMIARASPKGWHYHVFVQVTGQFSEMRHAFKTQYGTLETNNGLTKNHENDDLALVPLKNIIDNDHGGKDNVHTTDIDNNPVMIRGVTMDQYRWLNAALIGGVFTLE